LEENKMDYGFGDMKLAYKLNLLCIIIPLGLLIYGMIFIDLVLGLFLIPSLVIMIAIVIKKLKKLIDDTRKKCHTCIWLNEKSTIKTIGLNDMWKNIKIYGIWLGFIILLQLLLWLSIDVFYDIKQIDDSLRFGLMCVSGAGFSFTYLFVLKEKIDKIIN